MAEKLHTIRLKLTPTLRDFMISVFGETLYLASSSYKGLATMVNRRRRHSAEQYQLINAIRAILMYHRPENSVSMKPKKYVVGAEYIIETDIDSAFCHSHQRRIAEQISILLKNTLIKQVFFSQQPSIYKRLQEFQDIYHLHDESSFQYLKQVYQDIKKSHINAHILRHH